MQWFSASNILYKLKEEEKEGRKLKITKKGNENHASF